MSNRNEILGQFIAVAVTVPTESLITLTDIACKLSDPDPEKQKNWRGRISGCVNNEEEKEKPKVIPLELLPVPRNATPAEKRKLGTINMYRQFMGIDIQPDLDKFVWPENRPDDFGWFVFCPKGLTATDAIEKLCKPQFTTGVYINPEAYTYERDPSEPRLVLCRDTVERDKIWQGKSGDDLRDARRNGKEIPFLDHRERYVLEAIHYYIFKKHLDIAGLTRCPRSRYCDFVACAYWYSDKFYVNANARGNRYPDYGGREAIPLTLKS